jgi:hypothetical protein
MKPDSTWDGQGSCRAKNVFKAAQRELRPPEIALPAARDFAAIDATVVAALLASHDFLLACGANNWLLHAVHRYTIPERAWALEYTNDQP